MGTTQGYPCEGTPQDTGTRGIRWQWGHRDGDTPGHWGNGDPLGRGAQGRRGTRDTWEWRMWGIRGTQGHLHGWGYHDPRDRRWGQCGT